MSKSETSSMLLYLVILLTKLVLCYGIRAGQRTFDQRSKDYEVSTFELPISIAERIDHTIRLNVRWEPLLVVDTWLWHQEVPGSSPGCARSTLSPWERPFTCIFSPHSCVK